jgi:hypothetical protein
MGIQRCERRKSMRTSVGKEDEGHRGGKDSKRELSVQINQMYL